MEKITYSASETIQYGCQLAQLLLPGDLLLLDGDLGAGKTTFTQGIARGLGIKRPVKSPTFTLIREYPQAKYPLYHMDMYRLENASADDLGLQEYFDGAGIVIVEWSQFIKEQLPPNYLRINIERVDELTRKLQFQPQGARYQTLVQQLGVIN